MSSVSTAEVQAEIEALAQRLELSCEPAHIVRFVASLAAFPKAHLQDVCLAAACLEGDFRATQYLIARCVPTLRKIVRRTCLSTADAEDVLQDVLVKVLVGRPPTPPALRGYRGQGPLPAWLAVVAARASVDLVRQPKLASLADTLISSLAMAAPVPRELAASRKQQFKLAVEASLAELDDTDRQVLRLHLAGLVAEQIGRSMGLHRVSVARRISALRETLREKTLARMGESQDGLADDVSQLSVSIARLLAANPSDPQ